MMKIHPDYVLLISLSVEYLFSNYCFEISSRDKCIYFCVMSIYVGGTYPTNYLIN